MLDPENRGVLQLSELGRYTNSSIPPRYDHTCFLMKARYNCAKGPSSGSTDSLGPKASDYKLLLKDCDLQEYVKSTTISSIVDASPYKKDESKAKGKLTLLIYGNSFLRQIFESLVCAHESQITDFGVQVGGPALAIKSLKSRTNKISIDELGYFINYTEAQKGCHGTGGSDTSIFYAPGVEVPANFNLDCNDNIGWVEFDHSLKVHYIFRPDYYEQATINYIHRNVFRFVNVEQEVDFLLWNSAEMPEINIHKLLWNSNIPKQLRKINAKFSGHDYGANNPWITHPPDTHPCMPGIPDDEANLLLFLLGNPINITEIV